jgi:hypothetical protein
MLKQYLTTAAQALEWCVCKTNGTDVRQLDTPFTFTMQSSSHYRLGQGCVVTIIERYLLPHLRSGPKIHLTYLHILPTFTKHQVPARFRLGLVHIVKLLCLLLLTITPSGWLKDATSRIFIVQVSSEVSCTNIRCVVASVHA